MLNPRAMTIVPKDPEAIPLQKANSLAVVQRIVRDYLRDQKAKLALAVAAMIVYALANGFFAWFIDPVIKGLFIEKRADILKRLEKR